MSCPQYILSDNLSIYVSIILPLHPHPSSPSRLSVCLEYMAKIYYHDLPSVLCKILGVYTIRYDNKESGRKMVENVVVMENIFYQVGR